MSACFTAPYCLQGYLCHCFWLCHRLHPLPVLMHTVSSSSSSTSWTSADLGSQHFNLRTGPHHLSGKSEDVSEDVCLLK